MWPINLRDPLPLIPVPLSPGVPEAGLELQRILHRVYDAAGYEDYVYKKPILPPLPAEEASWAAEIVAKLAKV
jgi:hypothetical protein